jgi:hypothetical protein
MPDSLSKSFGQLTVRPSFILHIAETDIVKQVVASSVRHVQPTIPPPEPNRHRMFYGFETSMTWLVEYAKNHWNTNISPACDSDIINMNRSIELLERHSGARNVRIKTVVPQGIPIPPARKGVLLLPEMLPEHVGPIIALCSSKSRKRPTQVAVDALKQITGKEPQWWIDVEDGD